MTKDEAIDIFKCLAYHNFRPNEEEIDEAIKVLKQKDRISVLKFCPYCGNKIVIE
jgi:hypothetical protein